MPGDQLDTCSCSDSDCTAHIESACTRPSTFTVKYKEYEFRVCQACLDAHCFPEESAPNEA